MKCLRLCGRTALDGHLTCGDIACDEAGARDELAPALQRQRLFAGEPRVTLHVTIPRADFVALWSLYLACLNALNTRPGPMRAAYLEVALRRARIVSELCSGRGTDEPAPARGGASS